MYSPAGLGKTTLANIVAEELKVELRITSGPIIEKPGDLIGILMNLKPGDILFIDEIHRIPKHIEELLYTAMEDFVIDIIVGRDQKARSIRLDLPPFTLIGATTKIGSLTAPLRDRFGVIFRLNYYSDSDIKKIIHRTVSIIETRITDDALTKLASCSRGDPRITNRLVKRLHDFALVENNNLINLDILNKTFKHLNIANDGLDFVDLKILKTILYNYKGGPVGLRALASSTGEELTTIEEVYEPFLIQRGYIKRCPRGRMVTEKTYQYFKEKYPE